MKLAPLDTFLRLRMVSLVTRSVPASPFWRLWMRPVSSRGLSSTEPCFISGVHRDRLATSYRLVLDFKPLCGNLLAALDAARSASMSYSAVRSFMRPAAFRVRRGESQCPHLGRSIAPVLRVTCVA